MQAEPYYISRCLPIMITKRKKGKSVENGASSFFLFLKYRTMKGLALLWYQPHSLFPQILIGDWYRSVTISIPPKTTCRPQGCSPCMQSSIIGDLWLLFQYKEGLHFWAIPVLLVCVFAFLIAHCFLSIYEVSPSRALRPEVLACLIGQQATPTHKTIHIFQIHEYRFK